MSEESQQEIVSFLSQGAAYGIDTPVDVIVTHISRVFLAGERVYKLKRAVHLPYVDFTDLATRKHACDQELALNRRTAPAIYLDVVAVTRAEDGSLTLGGEGDALDWLVVMHRFEQAALLDALAQQPGGLTRAHMEELAESLAAFHDKAEVFWNRGGYAATAAVAYENVEVLSKFGAGRYDGEKMRRLATVTDAQLAKNAALLDRRRDEGRVRRGHGDLHLRNIVMFDGHPTPFDCIEFNDDFAIIDTMYDLAFLLMDLEHRNLRDLANAVLNRTLDLSGDVDALACLPLFLSMRAAVRAHVDAAQRKFDEGASYLDLALQFLTPQPPRLLAVGGLSGSGKSSLAQLIAPGIGRAPGAVVLRSDATRKRLMGVGLYEELPRQAYSAAMSEQVYARLLLDAERAVLNGHSVILDAVHAKPEERQRAQDLAAKCGVPFVGLWLDVPLSVRQERIGGRLKDVSDATAEVAQIQDEYDLGPMDWLILDASADLKTLATQARSYL